MNEEFSSKKQSDGQLALYRLLRLQNRENNFHYRDDYHRAYFKVSYQHFPLETIQYSDLLKTFWKFITTHYFKKIDQEEIFRLNYIRNVFKKYQTPQIIIPPPFSSMPRNYTRFWYFLTSLISEPYLQTLTRKTRLSQEDSLWLKKVYVEWSNLNEVNKFKTKKIKKPLRTKIVKPQNKKRKIVKQGQYSKEDRYFDQMINKISEFQQEEDDSEECLGEMNDIDDEIYRLERELQQTSEQNITLINQIEARIIEEESQQELFEQKMVSGEDARCLEWLIHNLEQKQISESISKIVSCQKKEGQSNFLVNYENALNLMPQSLGEHSLRRMNQLRQTSLLKFYRTGMKSTYSFVCQNYVGFADLCHNRMSLSRAKDKDYLLAMKKTSYIPHDIKQQFQQFDVCHQCKFLYPLQLLTTCKFANDRQSMPKISEGESDFGAELSLQKGRVSQRFVTKHRNCMTGYAWINEQYVCGRKFCLNCIKDNYGKDWMKVNNGICPFCEGVCNCTRCIRNQKMNKLKSFFISLGGDIVKLQSQGLIEKLSGRKDQIVTKGSIKLKKQINSTYPYLVKPKVKRINKENKKKNVKVAPYQTCLAKRWRMSESERREAMIEQEIEKWSSTAQKELQNSIISRRTSSRRLSARIY